LIVDLRRPLVYTLFPYTTLFRSHTLSGTVLDDNQQPLIGASIEVKGLSIYTSADEKGNFSLRLPSGNYTVVITFLGFKNRQQQRSEEHTSELQSRENLVCRLLLE